MDLLAKRYASPFLVLDEFIRLHQLHDFIMETLKTIADEKVNERRWQYYVHRVDGMSFEEYVQLCEKPDEQEKTKQMTNTQISNVVNDSRNILQGLKVPE